MNILLVEDNDTTAYLTEAFLEKTGFASRVDRTYRIKPFESLCHVNKYDLAIIDYHLQYFDAPEFVRAIKKSKKNKLTPVIIVSHELSPYELREVERLGVHYIRRPDDYMVFMDLIKRTLRRMN